MLDAVLEAVLGGVLRQACSRTSLDVQEQIPKSQALHVHICTPWGGLINISGWV